MSTLRLRNFINSIFETSLNFTGVFGRFFLLFLLGGSFFLHFFERKNIFFKRYQSFEMSRSFFHFFLLGVRFPQNVPDDMIYG